MGTNLDKEPDYGAIFQALLQKTREGKLAWQETADAHTFVAAVRGERTFEISLVFDDFRDIVQAVHLVVRDSEGKLFFDISMPYRAQLRPSTIWQNASPLAWMKRSTRRWNFLEVCKLAPLFSPGRISLGMRGRWLSPAPFPAIICVLSGMPWFPQSQRTVPRGRIERIDARCNGWGFYYLKGGVLWQFALVSMGSAVSAGWCSAS